MLTKFFKTINLSTLVVVVVSLSISIYTIVMYRSFLNAERQDIAYMKEQIVSLSKAVESILNMQQHNLEKSSFLPPDIMSMFTSAINSDNGPEVLVNEKFVPQQGTTLTESNGMQPKKENQTVNKNIESQISKKDQSEYDKYDKNDNDKDDKDDKDDNDDNDSTSSEDTHRLISSMLTDNEEDEEDDEKDEKDEKDKKDEKEEQKEFQSLKENENLDTKLDTKSDTKLDIKIDEKEEVFTPEINHLLNTKKQNENHQNQNIEDFILGHLTEKNKENDEEKNVETNVKSEESVKSGESVKSQEHQEHQEEAVGRYPTLSELSTWRYEKLRQFIKSKFHISISKGTKNELIAKAQELISLQSLQSLQ